MLQLPVFGAFIYILRSAIGNLNIALRLVWPWTVILAPAYLVFQIWHLNHADLIHLQASDRSVSLISVAALLLLSGLAFSSFAVNWHRYALLGEIPGMFGTLRIDGKTWRYFGNLVGIGLLIAFMMIFPMIPIAIAFSKFLAHPTAETIGQSTAGLTVLTIIAVAIYLIISAYGTRMLVKLVGIAVGNKDSTISFAMEATAENTLRIAGVNLLLLLVFVPVDWGLPFVMTNQTVIGSTLLVSILVGIQMFSNVLKFFAGIVALTALYRYFVENQELA